MFGWPLYNLAHVCNRETPRLSVFDPFEQCEALRLGVSWSFWSLTVGVKAQAGREEVDGGGMWLERQQVVCPQAVMLQQGPSLGNTHVSRRG